MTIREVYRNRGLFAVRKALAAGIVIALAPMLSAAARAATITVNSLADPGATGICVLRDAITAANTMAATNGCAAGTGNDTIQFSVTGTVPLASTLPQITDSFLTINGPASPGVAIDGHGTVQVMVVLSGAVLNLNKLTIANGFTHGYGGGLESLGTLTVTNSTFFGNSSADGGGIFSGGTLTVINSIFSYNSALIINCCRAEEGGAIYNDGGTLTITNSTFFHNITGAAGGGIENNQGGTLIVTNTTFFFNNAAFGGGIANGGTLTVTNSTFSVNSAGGGGGDIYSNSAATFKSTILAASGSGGNCSGTIVDAGYNISDDTTCAFSATGSHNNTDPKLDRAGLRNNGGPTPTIALLDGSPAFDAIPIARCTDQASPANPIITDQRLFPRPDAGEANCDIGAYEFEDTAFLRFSHFVGSLKIDPDAGVFYLGGGFTLGAGGSIDPTKQPVAFSVGSYAIRLPAGFFVKHSTGYVYQKTVNRIFLRLFIKFTNTPGSYVLLANRIGGTVTGATSPVPVTLTVGNDSGTTQMNARFN